MSTPHVPDSRAAWPVAARRRRSSTAARIADVVALCVLCTTIGVLAGVTAGRRDQSPAGVQTYLSTVHRTERLIVRRRAATVVLTHQAAPVTVRRTYVKTVTLPAVTLTVTLPSSGSTSSGSTTSPR
jgi:hypothetical protein